MLTAQTQETINDEVLGLAQVYQRGGLPMLVRVVEARSRQPGANLYLIADANGQILTGNVQSLEPGVIEVITPASSAPWPACPNSWAGSTRPTRSMRKSPLASRNSSTTSVASVTPMSPSSPTTSR